MNTSVKVLAILNLLGAAQGLLLACALLSLARGNRLAQRLLAVFVAAIAVVVSSAVILTTGFLPSVPHLAWVHHPVPFLLMPLLYLYLRTLCGEQATFARRELWHFVPAALCVAYLVPFYLQPAAAKLATLASTTDLRWYVVRSTLGAIQAAVYLAFLLVLLRRFAARLQAQPTPTGQAVLRQARLLTLALAVLWMGAWVRLAVNDHGTLTNLLIPLAASTIVYVLAYQVLRQPVALLGYEPPVTPKKYERSRLTPERAAEYLQRLEQTMQTHKPYTDGSLTVQKLAEQLAIPASQLSQLVNERLGQSFSDFVNAHRVAEAQALMHDPARQHYSLLAIAEEAGFKSKSSFNAVFKKHTGLTPSEFRDTLQTTN